MWILLTVIVLIVWSVIRKSKEVDLLKKGYRPVWSTIYDSKTGTSTKKIVWISKTVIIDDNRIDM